MPAVSGVLLANVSIPLAFAVAVAWRYRDSVWQPAWALGLAVSAKFLMWPLLVWTVATRRLRATALCRSSSASRSRSAPGRSSGSTASTGYPDLLRRLSEIQAERSYSIVGIAATAGLGEAVGQALAVLVGGGLLVGCVLFARRGDDPRSFTCAVAATLALSPIVWLHYLVVLLVPMAIARPRFSLALAAPRAPVGEPATRLRRGIPDLHAGDRSRDSRRGAPDPSVPRRSLVDQARMTQAPADVALGRRRLVSTTLLVGVAAALVAGLLGALGTAHSQELGWDFRVAYLPGAEAVVRGASPYPDSLDGVDVPTLYAYPPQLAFVLTPFTTLPEDVAVAIVVLLTLAALMGSLALVGVRDLRCYAAVVLWLPGWNALQLANVSAALVLLVACAWRFRATVWPLAATLAAAISLKLFLWPLLVWGVATRRLRATALSVGIGLVGTAAAWAAIGFAGLATYPELLSTIAEQESYSIAGMVEELGFGRSVARLGAVGVGIGAPRAVRELRPTLRRRARVHRARSPRRSRSARSSGCTTSFCSSCRSVFADLTSLRSGFYR